MQLEPEWKQYPVIHLDLSGAKHMTAQGVRDEMTRIVSEYEMKNVTMLPAFSSICGITENEVRQYFSEEISMMASDYGITSDEMFLKIKDRYDALGQIDDKSYAIPVSSDDRKVVKVGVKFNKQNRIPEDWVWKNQ